MSGRRAGRTTGPTGTPVLIGSKGTSVMPRYRKKPVVVDAIRYDGDPEPVFDWARRLGVDEDAMYFHTPGEGLIIRTLEGNHRADPGDWIICGVAGEYYPCKPAIFEATYEAVPY